MTSQRKQRRRVYSLMRERGGDGRLEDRQWDSMPAVGREFGSPDFDRLMEEDYRQGRGVFDPALAAVVGKRRMGLLKERLVVPEDFDASFPDDVLADFEGGVELEVPDGHEP